MNSPDGPSLKRTKGQGSTTDGRESDRRTKTKTEYKLKRSSRFDWKKGDERRPSRQLDKQLSE